MDSAGLVSSTLDSPDQSQKIPRGEDAAARTPAATSSAMMPTPPGRASKRFTGHGFATSKKRKRKNPAMAANPRLTGVWDSIKQQRRHHGQPLAGNLVDDHRAGIALAPPTALRV